MTTTFIKDERIVDGTVVAIENGEVLWAGPVYLCPLEAFTGSPNLHVHPALYDRIAKEAAAREEGIPYA